ncbi:MAG: ATP-binding protein [Bacteroidaceae bacterium]|nr:ATP-binding protein [Bacteroidaceae bacterium]
MKEGEYIERSISATILEAAKYFPVVCITGPRQSGKSTLIKHLFPNFVRYTLEDLDVRNYAKNDPVAFLNQTEKGMVLDEVHRVPELLSYIQGIVDDHPERKFILSGSSNFALIRSVSQSLAGRVGMFDLLPMSMAETQEMVERKSLDELLFDGLYPSICAQKNVAHLYYPSYVRTYLDRDVREMVNVKDMMQFNTFLQLCAGRIGSVFNASELANEVGVSSNTITSWLSILEASYVITLLHPYSGNAAKRLIKSPKLYFCDTGLACHLLDIESPTQLSHDKMRGHLFENLIVMEALKMRFNRGKKSNMYFYRDSNKNEIDLLTKENGILNGFEIKSSMTYSTDFQKTISKLDTYIKEPTGTKAIIYAGNMENAAADIKLFNYKHISELF